MANMAFLGCFAFLDPMAEWNNNFDNNDDNDNNKINIINNDDSLIILMIMKMIIGIIILKLISKSANTRTRVPFVGFTLTGIITIVK